MTKDVIREAYASDAEAIAGVHVRSWQETYQGIVPSSLLDNLSITDRANWWREVLNAPAPLRDLAAFVAVASTGSIVGFGACGRQRSQELVKLQFEGEFQAIYVLRDAQRRALGKRLMAEMAESLLAKGLQGGALWVLRDNHPARRFYEALNGSVVAEQEDQRSPEIVFRELAYGWNDLSRLNRLST